MVSEQEAIAASKVLQAPFDDQAATIDEMLARADQWKIVHQWAREELSRRDAERSELDQPIDAEWLESIGFHNGGAWLYMAYHGGKVYVGSDKLYVYVNASPIYAITTRGQLLDLLAALKGGAT